MNYWDKEEDFNDRDMEETNGEYHAPLVMAPGPDAFPRRAIQPPVVQVSQVSEEDEDDYSEVLSDARLRLEQGRLYELLMNHNLFEGVQADPRAIKNVQRAIRRFSKEQMETMLGMRQPEAPKAEAGSFNEVEVSVLRMLASAASKGKTAEAAPARQGLAPMVAKQAPSVQKLPSVVKSAQVVKPAPKKEVIAPKPAPAPITRKKNDQIEKILREEGVSRELIEENYKPLKKDVSEMTEEEKIDRNREVSQRLRKQVQSPDARPMPSYEQQAMQYAQQASEVAASGPMSLLLAAVSRKK